MRICHTDYGVDVLLCQYDAHLTLPVHSDYEAVLHAGDITLWALI